MGHFVALKHFEHKTRYLRENSTQEILCEMSMTFEKTISTLIGECKIPQGIFHSLELDLTYCILRNKHWIHIPLFRDTVSDFLVTDFRIEKLQSDELVDAMLDLARSKLQSERKYKTEKDFLSYVFAETMTSKNNDDLISDLGFGSTLLNRIKNIAQDIDDSSTEKTKYLPELDAAFSEIVVNFSETLHSEPWAIDATKLKFLLLDIAEPWLSLLDDKGPEWIFNLLLHVGKSGKINTKQFSEFLAQLLNLETSKDESLKAGHNLLSELASRDLVYLSESSARGTPYSKWQLSSTAERLTANAFANIFRYSTATSQKLSRLNPSYQHCVINLLPLEKLSELLDLLAPPCTRLSPEGLQAASNALRRFLGKKAQLDTLQNIMANSTSPWIRIAAIQCLSSINKDINTEHAINFAAENDSSEIVRNEAIKNMYHFKNNVIRRETQA